MHRVLVMALVEAVTAFLVMAYFPFDVGPTDIGTIEEAGSRLAWLALLWTPSLIAFVGATLLWVRSFAAAVGWAKLNLRGTAVGK